MSRHGRGGDGMSGANNIPLGRTGGGGLAAKATGAGGGGGSLLKPAYLSGELND